MSSAELHDHDWNLQERDETAMQRLDRNWADLLQELRVLQTGVQLLTGFLLTLPFQNRFAELTAFQEAIYLATVALAVGSIGFLIAPVSLHRTLFRRHARHVMVSMTHRLAVIGVVLLSVAITGVVLLIFDVVAGRTVGLLAAAGAALLLATLWAAVPWYARGLNDRAFDLEPDEPRPLNHSMS
jgi:small-conductance mechanosensitive channel